MARSNSTSGAEVAEDGVDLAVWFGSIGRQVARLSCIPDGGSSFWSLEAAQWRPKQIQSADRSHRGQFQGCKVAAEVSVG